MTKYVESFVSAHDIKFDISKRNRLPFEKSHSWWDRIRSSLNIKEDSVILFCGAKNNGKSALVRYLINRYLHPKNNDIPDIDDDNDQNDEQAHNLTTSEVRSNKNRFVYYVDFDPGQPEMTTPGVVSGHMIHQDDVELQSPTFLNVNQHKPFMVSSVGGINMTVNPNLYMENCRYVFKTILDHRRNASEKQPIFINTMGYIRNVGLTMLMDLIKITRPTDVVVLNVEGDPMRTIYADLTARAISNTRASFYYETHEESRRTLKYEYHLNNLDFAFVDSSTIATKNRIALQLAYLSQIPSALYKPIMHLTPQNLSIEHISFYCVSSYPLKTEIVLELLNHSWVHLVRSRSNPIIVKPLEPEAAGVASSINLIDDVGKNELLGCGIVTDIDLEARKIAIITPMSEEELRQMVNCVIKPLSIQVPREIIQDGQ